jgi:hypothetical protein
MYDVVEQREEKLRFEEEEEEDESEGRVTLPTPTKLGYSMRHSQRREK